MHSFCRCTSLCSINATSEHGAEKCMKKIACKTQITEKKQHFNHVL